MEKIILASSSPRRRELMAQAGFAFEVLVSEADETIETETPGEMVEVLSSDYMLLAESKGLDRKTLIRRLLVEQLLPEEKQKLLKRNSVENEMKKQWKQFEDDPIKSEVKKRIWRNVQRRCEGKSDTLVHIELW